PCFSVAFRSLPGTTWGTGWGTAGRSPPALRGVRIVRRGGLQRLASAERMRRWPMKHLLALVVTLAVAAARCASTERITASGEGAEPDSVRMRSGINIIGYTTSDGRQHSYAGTAQLLDDGMWHFTPHGYGSSPFTLRQDQVSWLSFVKKTPQ